MVVQSLFISLLLLVGPSPFQSKKEQIQALNRQLAQLKEMVYTLEKKIAQLENKPDPTLPLVDQMRTMNAELKETSRQLREEMDRLSSGLKNVEKRMTELEKKSTQVVVDSGEAAGGPQQVVPGEMVQEQFRQARLDFDRGKYEVAEAAFRDLLAQFPNSTFSDDCRFFLAQSRMQQKGYQEAGDLFAQVAAGDNRHALQARLYEGQCQYHLGLYAKAVAIFDDLILKSPNSQEADLARRFLKQKGL